MLHCNWLWYCKATSRESKMLYVLCWSSKIWIVALLIARPLYWRWQCIFCCSSQSVQIFNRGVSHLTLQQPQEQSYPILQVYTGSFCVSVIYQTLTWTTGSWSCLCDHSYVCVHTWGLGNPDSESAHFLLERNHYVFLCSCRDLNSGHGQWSPTSTLPIELPCHHPLDLE